MVADEIKKLSDESRASATILKPLSGGITDDLNVLQSTLSMSIKVFRDQSESVDGAVRAFDKNQRHRYLFEKPPRIAENDFPFSG